MQRTTQHERYRPLPTVDLPDRTWPARRLSAAPRWLSTDLRDGNQALARPMDPGRKLAMFNLLTRMGYTEIEVGYPAASRDEYDFVRMLIERDLIPDGVRITVMTQARDDLIERTAQCLIGSAAATLHVYNATAPRFRELVFDMTRAEVKALAVEGTRAAMRHADRHLRGCEAGYQYSPEVFNETEPEFALEVCEAVLDVWQPDADRPIVLNFPATVERAAPTVFADQIEWMHRNLSRHEHVCLSVHPHNDRGTAVAAAELAVRAGAQRIEGCLFGGGERAGNVCLVTLGINLLADGIDPGIDFSDLDSVRRIVEECTGMAVPPRHPYAGDLVFTAFSGAHQDAIKKGFDELRAAAERTGAEQSELAWQVPYLPVDPRDLGRGYEALVRINSQSGKGGVAYLLADRYGFNVPRGLQVEFAPVVQALADRTRGELTPAQVKRCFDLEYLLPAVVQPYVRVPVGTTASLHVQGTEPSVDLLDALRPLGVDVTQQQLVAAPSAADQHPDGIVVYAHCCFPGGEPAWGVGVDRDERGAALRALRSAAARAEKRDRMRTTDVTDVSDWLSLPPDADPYLSSASASASGCVSDEETERWLVGALACDGGQWS
ncbi:MAG TPA: 2-isopropylmalate synthase [Actinocrinis sp.]|nr:2-isopropylmalate synthase [Actinocrinis sp.]